MAEEDEIDILGDFNLDNYLTKNDTGIYESASLVSQNTDLLNCDYTIHPQWLLDKPSANPDNWYDTNLSTGLPQSENDSLVSTENCITDESGWTEKEKNLLERGIEIFGKSNVRLSQFIGSKTAAEVKYYLKNFYLENQTTYRGLNEGVVEESNDNNLVSDILDDTQIPASIEEVIASVCTAKPTVLAVGGKKSRKKNTSSTSSAFDVDFIKDIPSGQSLLKSNYVMKNTTDWSKTRKTENISKQRKQKNKINRSVKFKFKTKLKVPGKERKKVAAVALEASNKSKVGDIRKIEITTGKGLAVPLCEGEEIVNIKKAEDSDVDVEVDVEDSDEDVTSNVYKPTNAPAEQIQNKQKPLISTKTAETTTAAAAELKTELDLSHLDEATTEKLMSLTEPTQELLLEETTITELEKVIHSEFFEGRPTKTPARYLKIRNHIINSWIAQKPAYVTKTSIRQGLKNCGDVNCIGRIHYFLEQVGAINFGCSQLCYARPLSDMVIVPTLCKEKSVKESCKIIKSDTSSKEFGGSRPRNKKKFSNDGEGGCTLTHDERGQVINTTIVNEEPVVKQRVNIKKPSIRLIYCRPFTMENPQKYRINFRLSTLLTMDFHAHTSLTEVMGLIAGYWSPQDKTLTVCHYEPCRNIASSATHCDMCPISQAKAADSIHTKGLDILGWFHSHPTFAPEPSQQDLDTQQVVQQWIGHKKPCIGVILSPFSLNGALIASPFRCLIVDKKQNFEDQFVPYKFSVDLVAEGFDVEMFVNAIREICHAEEDSQDNRVDFVKPYFQDSTISYLDKYIASVRMYLAKCGNFSKITSDRIIEEITNACGDF